MLNPREKLLSILFSPRARGTSLILQTMDQRLNRGYSNLKCYDIISRRCADGLAHVFAPCSLTAHLLYACISILVWSGLFRYADRTCVRILNLCHACCMLHSSHFHRFEYHNNI
jgi:hypothetical protein